MELGLIGFGEAAFELSKGLKSQGFGNIYAYDHLMTHPNYGERVKARAEQATVDLLDSPKKVLESVEMVLVAVPADKANGVSADLKPHLRAGMVYVDVSASTPAIKNSIWEQIRETGVSFVDAAMLGPLTMYQHKVPMLISGSGSSRFAEQMSPYGMNLNLISENPGDASAVKLIRSIYMKGVAALFVEVLEAAHQLQVEELVIQSLQETMESQSFLQNMNQLVTGTAIHAERRAMELEGSIEMLESLQINSVMAKAARDKLKYVSEMNIKEQFQGERPEKWTDVINLVTACRK